VLIILFVVCSIAWDVLVTKPEMRKNIEEIRTEVKDIHEKIDVQMRKDSLTYQFLESRRAAILEEIESKKAQNGEEKE
jgi:hypothetical protein